MSTASYTLKINLIESVGKTARYSSHFRFSLFTERKMQFENNNSNSLHDRARLFARIPPCIDLSAVTNCVSETEKRWKSSSNQNGSSFNKPLHIKTSNIENAVVVKMGTDGLPIGEFEAIFLFYVNTT